MKLNMKIYNKLLLLLIIVIVVIVVAFILYKVRFLDIEGFNNKLSMPLEADRWWQSAGVDGTGAVYNIGDDQAYCRKFNTNGNPNFFYSCSFKKDKVPNQQESWDIATMDSTDYSSPPDSYTLVANTGKFQLTAFTPYARAIYNNINFPTTTSTPAPSQAPSPTQTIYTPTPTQTQTIYTPSPALTTYAPSPSPSQTTYAPAPTPYTSIFTQANNATLPVTNYAIGQPVVPTYYPTTTTPAPTLLNISIPTQPTISTSPATSFAIAQSIASLLGISARRILNLSYDGTLIYGSMNISFTIDEPNFIELHSGELSAADSMNKLKNLMLANLFNINILGTSVILNYTTFSVPTLVNTNLHKLPYAKNPIYFNNVADLDIGKYARNAYDVVPMNASLTQFYTLDMDNNYNVFAKPPQTPHAN